MNLYLLIAMFGFILVACGSTSMMDESASASCTPSEESATYQVTFTSVWSAETHPTDFPDNPHFSTPIGTTHNDSYTLWESGEISTQGIEDMAELGSVTTLSDEINTAIAAGTNGVLVVFDSGLGESPGSIVGTFVAQQDYHLFSLVTMVAPSPDWFVGFSAIDLCEDDAWKESVTIANAYAYDAGTDSGPTFTSDNADVTPHEVIARIETNPVINESGDPIPFGSFSLQKQ